MNDDLRGLFIQSEQARERGDFKKALELLSSAVVVSHDEGKYERLCDIAASQALVYRHLFDSTKSKHYLVLSKHAAMASAELAREANDPTLLCIALYNLGKSLESNGEFDEALKNFQVAVSQNVDRPAMISEMKTRLAVLKYKNGDESAMARFEKALNELVDAQDKDNYAKGVWVSGAYMHMAEALIGKDDVKAKELLKEAERVIDSDMRLKLRKQQLAKLQQEFI